MTNILALNVLNLFKNLQMIKIVSIGIVIDTQKIKEMVVEICKGLMVVLWCDKSSSPLKHI